MASSSAMSCPQCLADVDGFAACEARFHEVIAKEFSDATYYSVHRLTVDAYSLQHPHKYMTSAKSYVAHLTGAKIALESDRPSELNRLVQAWLSNGPNLERPGEPKPGTRGELTVLHVVEAADAQDHARRVREWAESAWRAWHEYHRFAEDWIRLASDRGRR